MQMQVKIGSDFFAKGLKDYSNWVWAWVRELCQNGIDCGSSNITFEIKFDGFNTIATCWNDGPPMTREILLDKFLCLGGTTKTNTNSVGGFGIAKTVIALAHKSYTIETGALKVTGSGGEFQLSESSGFNGTLTEVVMSGDVSDRLIRTAKRFAGLTQWSGTITVNGDVFECNKLKGTRRRDLEFGVVYTNKTESNVCVVRIGGIPMFTNYCSCDGRMVLVELTGSSSDVLTSNRDGLVTPYSQQLSQFITELAVDNKKALKATSPSYTHFSGSKLGHYKSNKEVNIGNIVSDIKKMTDMLVLGHSDTVGAATSDCRYSVDTMKPVKANAVRKIAVESEFILKNETELTIPDYYSPESSSFSAYSVKLAKVWGKLLVQLHRLFDREDSFAIGFIFSGDAAAQHEQGQFGRVYYIAPAEVVTQKSSSSKSFSKMWSFDSAGRKKLLAVAVHEFVHGLGYSWHDESYANKFTSVMAIVMENMSSFGWCYR